MAFNATFNNISTISWLSVLLVTIIRAGAQNTQINYVKLESNVNNTTIIKTTKLNMRTIITVIVIITACVVLSEKLSAIWYVLSILICLVYK